MDTTNPDSQSPTSPHQSGTKTGAEATPQTPPRLRLVFVTAAERGLSATATRLMDALRLAGCEVTPLPMPLAAPKPPQRSPSVWDLKRLESLARDVLSLGETPEPAAAPRAIVAQLKQIQGDVDGVVALAPDVAGAVFPLVSEVFGDAVCVAVDGDFHLEDAWYAVAMDHIVVPHPALAGDLGRVRGGLAGVFAGGPVTGRDATIKRLGEDKPTVVLSAALLDPGDVDPLLFQLSLAKPERFHLLFLASGRGGVDELLRQRAATYGLRGKRAKAGADHTPWIRGASVIVGRPAPSECAVAVTENIPMLLLGSDQALSRGDRFLVGHQLALQADVPLTIAVKLEGLLPGGVDRDAALEALEDFPTSGADGAAAAIREAVTAGRIQHGQPASADGGADLDDDLEEIGGPAAGTGHRWQAPPESMSLNLRRAYLKEIILQSKQVQRQLQRAQAGLSTWQRRVQLARAANDHLLADKAVPRVDGLVRVADRLRAQLADVQRLRDVFASRAPITEADRRAAASFMDAEVASTVDRVDTDAAFARIEMEDALASLKRKLRGG